MKQINLTKKAVGGGRLRLTTDGTHITNGHWAARLDLFKQAPLLTSVDACKALYPRSDVEEITPSLMDAIVPGTHAKVKFKRTHWIQVCPGGEDSVLFVAEEEWSGFSEEKKALGPTQLWINRRYVDLFDLEEVESSTLAWTLAVFAMRMASGK
jgi:hypothetical protein